MYVHSLLVGPLILAPSASTNLLKSIEASLGIPGLALLLTTFAHAGKDTLASDMASSI